MKTTKFFLVLVLVCGVTLPVLKITAVEPVLVLDAEIPDRVGDIFNVELTAFDRSSEDITIQILFDNTVPAFQDTRPWFVNAAINLTTSLLTTGMHNITIKAINNDGQKKQLFANLEVDRTAPTISYFEISEYSTKDDRKVVYYGQTILLNWKAADEHFSEVRIFQNTKLVAAFSDTEGTYRMSFQFTSESRQETYEVYLRAYDEAGNQLKSKSFFVQYIDERVYMEPEEAREERIRRRWYIIAGTATSIIAAVVSSAYLFIKFKKQKARGHR